jgi:hypothetical protein
MARCTDAGAMRQFTERDQALEANCDGWSPH